MSIRRAVIDNDVPNNVRLNRLQCLSVSDMKTGDPCPSRHVMCLIFKLVVATIHPRINELSYTNGLLTEREVCTVK